MESKLKRDREGIPGLFKEPIHIEDEEKKEKKQINGLFLTPYVRVKTREQYSLILALPSLMLVWRLPEI